MMLLEELHDMGFKRAHYIPNGVDADLFKPTTPIKKQGQLIVGHVGKECPAKGQKEFILPAIQTTKCESYTNLRTWKDRLPHTDMPEIYNQMDVFVVASAEDGTPNPALEAAACGRPIISNEIGNMPQLIKDGYNGFIVPKKIGAYVEKIRYFKKNRDELIRMGENARKTILEGWTWEKQSENYRKMFRKIFEKQK
jgi:spore maturation protein CgeB